MFIRASILAYTQQLEPRASCCLCHSQLSSAMPYTHFGHRQLRSFLVLERNQLLLRFASTNNHAMRFLQWTMSIQLATVPLCVVVCIPVHVGSLNVPCCISSRALYVYYIRYTEHVAHTPPVGRVAPARPKMLSIALV